MAAKKRADEEKSVKKAKKEETTGLSRSEKAAVLLDHVQKKLKGRAVLLPASQYVLPWVTKRIPTGILTLDLELKGGFPAGGISQLVGRRSAGKSLLMWQCIRQLQHFLGDKMMVLLAMTEIPADRSQARLAGVKIALGQEELQAINDKRQLMGLPPLTDKEARELAPEVGTIHELHALAVEDFYDIILQAVDSNIYHLIVIDSIGNALAAAEQENESVHDKVYGGISAPNTTFLKKLTNMMTMRTDEGQVRDTCVIGINQVRDNIKDPNAPYKAPGGNALEHAKLVDIYIESGGLIGGDQPVFTPAGWKQQFVPTGKDINWKIVKGKAGMHEGAKGKFVFQYALANIDFALDTLVAGVTHGIVSQSGAWLGIVDPDNPKEYLLRAQGKDAFIQALMQDAQQKAAAGDPESWMNYIRQACYDKAEIPIKYTDWE